MDIIQQPFIKIQQVFQSKTLLKYAVCLYILHLG